MSSESTKHNLFLVIFAGTALKLEKAGSTFSSFNVHPCYPLQQQPASILFTDAPSPQNRCTRVQSRVSLTTPFQLSEAKQKNNNLCKCYRNTVNTGDTQTSLFPIFF